MSMIDRKTWADFKSSGFLWWINRILHTFGWAIVFEVEDDGSISDVYPARVKFRGFDSKAEEEGFVRISDYLKSTASDLSEEANG